MTTPWWSSDSSWWWTWPDMCCNLVLWQIGSVLSWPETTLLSFWHLKPLSNNKAMYIFIFNASHCISKWFPIFSDALKDFSNPDLACPSTSNKAKPKKIEETDCYVLPKKQNAASSKPRESSEPNLDDLFSEESFAKMAEQFSKAFESMQPDDLELLQKMDEQEDGSGNQGIIFSQGGYLIYCPEVLQTCHQEGYYFSWFWCKHRP